MARLIDADAIPELFDKEYKATKLLIEQGEEHLDNLAEGFTEAHHVIQKMPTIEAEPVKHGHWISLTNCSNSGVYCSICHKKVYKEDYAWCNRKNKLRSNYCPNCGAKMDKGEEDG